ncbi:MAG TPA: ABC transporter permease [Acidimicrobiales bacterium]|nr:ABC transporter permease [Acidimicrobiales bacterium]
MSQLSTAGPSTGPTPGGSPSVGHYRPATWWDAIRSEWVKLRSLRSMTICSIITAVLAIGIGVLVCSIVASRSNHTTNTDPTTLSLAGLALGQLAVAILAVLGVASEYASGTISVSLLAVPKRTRFFLCKLGVITALCLVLGEVLSFVAFGIGQAILHGNYHSASLSQPHVARAVIGAGLYIAAIGLLSAGLGFLFRSTAAGVAVVVGVVFVLPDIIVPIVDGVAGTHIAKYWPTLAGERIFTVTPGGSDVMAPWTGFLVMLALVAAVVVAAWVVLEARDV